MAKFGNPEIKTVGDAPKSGEAEDLYKKIMPENDMSVSECNTFWRYLFNSMMSPETGGDAKDSRRSEDIEGSETAESQEEINEKQREAIHSALERLLNGEKLTDKEKGNLCEMMMDQYYISLGYTPLHSPRVTSLDDKGHQGIDGVYEKDGRYVIVDAKFGSAKLGETQDGTQMSREWIDRRLDASVGKEKADEIRAAYEEDPGSVSTEVYHYDPRPDENGNTYSDVYSVDEDGAKSGEGTVVETFPDRNRQTDRASENGGAHYER